MGISSFFDWIMSWLVLSSRSPSKQVLRLPAILEKFHFNILSCPRSRRLSLRIDIAIEGGGTGAGLPAQFGY